MGTQNCHDDDIIWLPILHDVESIIWSAKSGNPTQY